MQSSYLFLSPSSNTSKAKVPLYSLYGNVSSVWATDGIKLEEFPSLKKWYDIIKARPAVTKGTYALRKHRAATDTVVFTTLCVVPGFVDRC
jgi:hypothetical protein